MATARLDIAILARRYAQAIFSLAQEQQALELVEQDMAVLQKTLKADSSFQTLMSWPHLNKNQRQKMIEEVVKHLQVSSLTAKFLGVLTDNRRLDALLFMTQAFQQLMAEHRGERQAQVRVARPLSIEQKTDLETALSNMTQQKIKVETTVDSALIGGMVIQLGSYLLDSSVKTQLERLGQAVKGTA